MLANSLASAAQKQFFEQSGAQNHLSRSLCLGYNAVHRIAMAASSGFAAFSGHKYLSLETYKKSGEAVRTPVWFAADPAVPLDSSAAKIFIYTIGDTAKVKRMRNNPRVKIAPCDMRGNVLGPWVDAQAEFVTGEEAGRGMRLLNEKYFPWKQLLGFFALFSRRKRIVIALHPA